MLNITNYYTHYNIKSVFIFFIIHLLYFNHVNAQCTTSGHVSSMQSINAPICNFLSVNANIGIGAGSERTYTGIQAGEDYQFYVNLNGANISCVQAQWEDLTGNPIGGWFAISTDNNNPTTVTAPANAARIRITTTSGGAWVANSAMLNYKSTEVCPDYTIDEGGTVNIDDDNCGILFYDSGGPNGNYQNNENYTMTFCSGNGQNLRMIFNYFDTEDNGQSGRNQVRRDILDIYDGPTVNSPQMYSLSGTAQGVNQPPVVTSSQECLTFRFTSNNTVTRIGWEAFMFCTDEINNVATNFCETAPMICNLDGYTGSTSDFYNIENVNGQVTNGGQFFPGNAALDNNSFIKFIPDATEVDLELIISDCTPASCGSGGPGIQFVIIEGDDCNFTSTAAAYTTNNPPGTQNITLTGLNPGTAYYLMVDGSNCSVCNYQMTVTSGISVAAVDPENATICEGETIDLTASGGTSYVWSGTDVDGLTSPTVTVSEEGIYSVIVSGGNPECPDNVERFSAISVNPAVEIDPIPDVNECQSFTFPDITGTNLSGDEAYYTEPNGQGTSFQPGETVDYDPAITFPVTIYIYDDNNGCTDQQEFEVTLTDAPDLTEPDDVVSCDSYQLPTLTTGFYFNNPNGVDPIPVGTTLTASQTVYIFAENAANPDCESEVSFEVTIIETVTPTFDNLIDEVCTGETIDPLPTTSTNGIEGTWSPAINNTATTTYTFTADEDNCINDVEHTITILDEIVPTFDSVDPICEEDALAPLPTTSNNGVEGTWSPAINNTQTTTYTFTPDDDGCTLGTTLTIEVTEKVLPTFDQVDPICIGEPLDNLPTTSNNGIQGTWFPAMNNNVTTTYTFTPNASECAHPTTMTIEVFAGDTPIFDPVDPICQGDPAITLPTVSNDGIAGTWTPSFNNMQTTEYTFVPSDPCANTTTLIVEVFPLPTVSAGNDLLVCQGETIILSGTGATNYTWSGGVVNGIPFTPPVGTNTYTVTGETNGCTATDQVTVEVQTAINVTFESDVQEECSLLPITFTNTSQGNSASCLWSFGDGNTLSGCESVQHTYAQTGCFNVTLTVTSDAGCVSSSTINDMVCIQSGPIANFDADPRVVTVTNTQVDFINLSVGASNYEWFFGDGNTSTQVNPSNVYPDVADEFYDFILVAYNDIGCPDTARSIIEVQDDLIFYVPNAFTPNGNDVNDIFKPIFTSGFDPFNFNLLIFNRWGEVLFESNNAEVGWDGTYGGEIVKEGTYIWKIQFRNQYTDRREMHTGHVTLLK